MIHARTDYDRIQDPAHLIPRDEPVFLLRGQDIAAPGTLEYWADRVEALGASPEIVSAARTHAHRMREWQASCQCKTPDLPMTPK
jgi:hypothetical protein